MSTVKPVESQKLTKTVMFSLVSAISTILSSAVVVMWAIIADPPGDTIGKAFLTIFIASGFAFSLIAETRAEHSAHYVTPGRIGALVLLVLSGLYLTWNQVYAEPWRDFYERDFLAWFGVIFLLEGIVATLILLWPRMVSNMTTPLVRYTFDAGIGLVILVAALISFAWTTWDLEWSEDFWRVVLAIGVLALVTFTIPLVISMILAPKKIKTPYNPYPERVQASQQPNAWAEIVAREGETPPKSSQDPS